MFPELFPEYSLNVPSSWIMFFERALNGRWMFPEWALNVP
jgi:hypothetical protein